MAFPWRRGCATIAKFFAFIAKMGEFTRPSIRGLLQDKFQQRDFSGAAEFLAVGDRAVHRGRQRTLR